MLGFPLVQINFRQLRIPETERLNQQRCSKLRGRFRR
jgi:hypothetical protein